MWWESESARGQLEQLLGEINRLRKADQPPAEAHREILESADTRLAAYGTLRPGESNHQRLFDVPGDWREGVVDGVRFEAHGYPAFTWQPGNGQVPVSVLTAPTLPQRWSALDEFEGRDYCRILVPVTLADATLVVANLYEYIGEHAHA